MRRRTQTIICQINNIIWWPRITVKKSSSIINNERIHHLMKAEDMANALHILKYQKDSFLK